MFKWIPELTQFAPLASALFSAGGVLSWLLAWKEKKVAARLQEATANTQSEMAKTQAATALSTMQTVYDTFTLHTAVEIGQMKEEIKMLREVVESYKKTCDSCPNNNRIKGS